MKSYHRKTAALLTLFVLVSWVADMRWSARAAEYEVPADAAEEYAYLTGEYDSAGEYTGEKVYFLAAEDTILPLADETMPFWHDDYLYIASSVFTNQDVQERLNVYRIQDNAQGFVMIYNDIRFLIFEEGRAYAEGEDEQTYLPGLQREGGNYFVPAGLIAQHFDLLYSVTEVEQGYLVWLRRTSFRLQERIFASAAKFQLDACYREYLQNRVRSAESSPPDTPEDPEDISDSVRDQPEDPQPIREEPPTQSTQITAPESSAPTQSPDRTRPQSPAQPQTSSQTQSPAQSQTQSPSQSQSRTQTQSQTQSRTQTQSEPQSQAQSPAQSQTPSPQTDPVSSDESAPPSSDEPSDASEPAPSGSGDDSPVESVEPEPVPGNQTLYLCLRADADAAAFMDTLDRHMAFVTFFCDRAFLETQGSLLRRMSVTGYGIGLLANADDTEQSVSEQLEIGNRLLEQAACRKTRFALIVHDGGAGPVNGTDTVENLQTAVREQGFCCLETYSDYSGENLRTRARAETLLEELARRENQVPVWLDGQISQTGLNAFLTAADVLEDVCRPLTETAFVP